ncbi:MAG: adenine deaminase C-terminal domain-containing protein [Trueperaceae bacterium]|nr:adenine deaminase C-terminal domain-containing protein [Trueperaceae bacterium]
MAPHDASPDPGSLPGPDARRALVDVATGRAPADLHLRGAHVLDPFVREARPADVLITGRWIAAVVSPAAAARGDRPPAAATLELPGALLTPGLLDGHMHLESSLVTPARYAEAVLPRGVTGVITDPHEVANVAGVPAVRWLLAAARGLPFDVFATVPSCVPSTALETPGAHLDADAIRTLMGDDGVVGLAELMSFPDVVAGEPEALAKAAVAEAAAATVEGHAPGLGGSALQAYLAAGVQSDHEASRFEEGLEKLRAGMFLFVREGSVAKDAAALAPLFDAARAERLGFCSDDQLPHDLLRLGGVDHAVRTAIRAGADPLAALAAATWNVARHYRLPRRGAVAPGYLADLTAWGADLGDLHAVRVFKGGREVARDGALVAPLAGPDDPGVGAAGAGLAASVTVPADVAASLDAALRWRDGDPGAPVPVVGVRPGSLATDAREATPRVDAGRLAADPARDLALLTCTERHGVHGRSAAAYVQGFTLERGALACSVGHDHHNLMAVGADAPSIAVALKRVAALGGGLVAVEDGAVLAELALPFGGLLTDAPLDAVADALDALDAAAASLGVTLPSPLMALSFLGLAVIPDLKLTDRGLVDVREARLVPVPYGPAPTST